MRSRLLFATLGVGALGGLAIGLRRWRPSTRLAGVRPPRLDPSFPTVVIDAEWGHWWRIHSSVYNAWYFASSDDGRPAVQIGRFDLPSPLGTCYLAEYLAAGAAEHLRETGVSAPAGQVAANARHLSQMPLDRWYGRRIADFTSPNVMAHGAPDDIAAVPRDQARP